MSVKQIIRSALPRSLLTAIRSYRARNEAREYRNLTTQQVFSRIYESSAWGTSRDAAQKFFSGSGSHEQEVVSPYLTAVRDFLATFENKPDVVDLGCGDFHIGAAIRQFCGSYVACDIVPDLIAFNKEKYQDLDVDFRVLDLTEDALPKADVVFIRQVLQHLSNRHIRNALPKIAGSYKFLVLSEHLPPGSFTPNLDKPAGPRVRVASGSGLVLTRPPFNLQVKDERVICEVHERDSYGGVIRTTLYRLS